MKRILLSFCMLFMAAVIYGQAQEGSVEYKRIQQPAAVIELPYSPDVVTAAMNDYLSKKGRSKGTDLKGFKTFRNTQPSQAGSINADLYFKMERKSRKEKEVTVVSLLLTEPKEAVVAANNIVYLNMDEAKTYLNDLVPAIEAYNLELLIKEQNDAVIKAESKYKSLANDGEDLEKKRVSIEKNIQNNRADQQTQMNEVENQKQKLAALVSQRKS